MDAKLTLIGLAAFLTVAPLHSATNESAWRAGAASVVITPDQPMWMAGYASRTNVSQGKAGDLYAKALALDNTRGARLVIVTLDLLPEKYSFPAQVVRFGDELTLIGPSGSPAKPSSIIRCA